MTAQDILDRVRVQALKNTADGGMGGRPTPSQAEEGIQVTAMDVDEGDDAAIGVAAGDDGQDGEQEDVGQLVELAFGSAGSGNLLQRIQGNFSPWVGRSLSAQDLLDGGVASAPRRAVVPMTKRMAAYRSASHAERKPPVTLRHVAAGRSSRSLLLLSAGSSG